MVLAGAIWIMPWCPYCCEPLDKFDNLKKTWPFQSGKGGLRFYCYLYQCPRCKKKVRLTYTEKEARP